MQQPAETPVTQGSVEHPVEPGPDAHAPVGAAEQIAGGQAEPPAAATGVPAVDEVLASMADLADRPVAEHVAVFEQAHDRLRRALDARPDS